MPVEQALGYQTAPAVDAFAADEALQEAWLSLRREVLDSGNRRLVRLLRDFASAYGRCLLALSASPRLAVSPVGPDQYSLPVSADSFAPNGPQRPAPPIGSGESLI